MKSSQLGWPLAIASGAVISISLVQLAWQSAPAGETLLSPRSKTTPIRSPRLASTDTDANEEERTEQVSHSLQASIGGPVTALVVPATASTSGPGADWVPLNPPASTGGTVRTASGDQQGQAEVRHGRFQPTALVSPSRGIHIRVNPALPGNTLIVDDQRATVEGVIASDVPEESEIQISIEKDSASGERSIERKGRPLRAGAWGLSYEEELFRTKWGWAAFAEVQRIAKQKTGSSR